LQTIGKRRTFAQNFEMKKNLQKRPLFQRAVKWILWNIESTVVIAIVALLLMAMVYSVVPTFGEKYSEGVRYGYFQKYSCKGLFVKTGEGELVLKSSDGSSKGEMPVFEVFKFSDKHCGAWDSLVGYPVVLRYEQPYHMSRFDGSSGYQVISIEKNQKQKTTQ
jgi:hypothetical protein